MLMKATTRSVSVNTDLTWRHNDIYFKITNTDKHVTEPIQRQREVVSKTKQASTATILDYNVSDNPSSKPRKDKSPSTDRSSGWTKKGRI